MSIVFLTDIGRMNRKLAGCGSARAETLVLVVEDDAPTRDSLNELLRSAGLEAVVFPTAVAVLSTVAAHPRSCLLLDVGLPDENGLVVFERLVALGMKVPVILMTGRPDLARQARCLEPPAFAVLEKPFDDDLLLATIEGALDRVSLPVD